MGFLNSITPMLQGGAELGGAYAQAQAQRSQAAYQRSQYEANARLADFSAKDALSRGEKTATRYKTAVKGVIGKQRASYAAQGIDVNADSALDIQEDTAAIAAEDVATIKNNAWREAWGYKVSANTARGKGAFAEMAGRRSADATILSGGLKALGYGLKGGYEFFKEQ